MILGFQCTIHVQCALQLHPTGSPREPESDMCPCTAMCQAEGTPCQGPYSRSRLRRLGMRGWPCIRKAQSGLQSGQLVVRVGGWWLQGWPQNTAPAYACPTFRPSPAMHHRQAVTGCNAYASFGSCVPHASTSIHIHVHIHVHTGPSWRWAGGRETALGLPGTGALTSSTPAHRLRSVRQPSPLPNAMFKCLRHGIQLQAPLAVAPPHPSLALPRHTPPYPATPRHPALHGSGDVGSSPFTRTAVPSLPLAAHAPDQAQHNDTPAHTCTCNPRTTHSAIAVNRQPTPQPVPVSPLTYLHGSLSHAAGCTR